MTDLEFTIWNKPFDMYTPSEGFLFLIFVVLFTALVFKIFKGGIW